MEGIINFFKNLWAAMTATAPKVTAKKYDFSQMPQLEEGSSAEAVIILKKRLIELGYFKSDKPTRDFYEETAKAVKSFQKDRGLTPDAVVGKVTWAELEKDVSKIEEKFPEEANPGIPSAPGSKPSWKVEAEKYKGKVETDAAFSADFRGQIKKRTGISIPTIATSTWAWCGFAIMLSLTGVGLDYQKNGAMARDWQKYGQEVNWKKDGIPEGSIVQINHGLNCNSSSNNHVSMANGDCTVQDFFTADGKLKEGATIDLYGGNQGNTWRVSTYSAKEICTVRWPKDSKDFPKPGPILKSRNCTSGKSVKESTR